jgi:hypothetical protein
VALQYEMKTPSLDSSSRKGMKDNPVGATRRVAST